MARYAVLNKNQTKVITVVDTNAELAQKNGWVACPNNTAVDWEYNGSVFSAPAPNANRAKRAVKQAIRDLLRRTDWTQVPDNLNQNKRDAWQTYRQSLRALIAQAEVDPFNITFPEPPGDLDEDGL